MKGILLVSVLSLSLVGSALACSIDGNDGFVPENDMFIPADTKGLKNANIDEAAFDEIIDEIVKLYEPIVRSHGGQLKALKYWSSGTVNAYAHRQGGTWNVAMYGGLARHKDVTPDGLALAVCHEIGHHIGGAPKKSTWMGSSWVTNEGQADYFATLKCLRKVWISDDNTTIVSTLNVPQAVVDKCTNTFSNDADRMICQRSAMAGLSVAKLFQDLRRQSTSPDFKTPDTNVVSKTSHAHPATQCRLDTYYAGALCDVLDKDDVDQSDESVGVCSRSGGHSTGVRPLCWFKPVKKRNSTYLF